jgi:hypothetical protein
VAQEVTQKPMKFRGLIVAAVVLAALEGALYWSNHHKPKEPADADTANAAPKFLSVNEADATRIDLKKKDGELVLVKNSSGNWQITAPQPIAADAYSVSNLFGLISPLIANRVVEEKPSNLSQYGLAQPALEVDVTTSKDNKTQKLLIGDETPSGNAAFAKMDGDPRVFTVPKYDKTGLDKSVNDLRDTHLITVAQDKISRVEIIAKKEDMQFGRNKDAWQIEKPKPFRADQSQVDQLLHTLTDARMGFAPEKGDDKEADRQDDTNKVSAAFASGAPVATAKLTAESGTQELQVRKKDNEYYAKSSIVEGTYRVAGSVGLALEKNLDDFRNKKLFDFGFDSPGKIEVHVGPKAYFLTKGGDDWWSADGKKVDPSSAQSLLFKIRDLSAAKFVDSGFTTATVEISAISKDGKRIEKVLIAKSGDNYIARHENEPALYQLDGKSVDDLETAAANLKPAEPPKAAPSKK